MRDIVRHWGTQSYHNFRMYRPVAGDLSPELTMHLHWPWLSDVSHVFSGEFIAIIASSH